MSPSENLDVLVVGAGPAGAACAYGLARRGARVMLLEKERLPRVKPCGGGVSPQVARWFDFPFEPVLSAKVRRVRFTYRSEDPVESELGTSEPLWMVRRELFDHYLVQQAVGAGALLREGCAALGAHRRDGMWQVESGDGPLRARFLVAADGAKGPTAKWLGLACRARQVAGALEGEVALPRVEGDTVHFDLGAVTGGYRWNFPKADGWSIGSGVFLGREGRDLRVQLEAYCRDFSLDPLQCRIQGHPLLLWDGDQDLHTDGALLAGEAACLVDPLTAEGIRPALRSGVLAAQALGRALEGDVEALPAYTAAVQQELGQEFRWARRLARILYRFPALGYRVVLKHPRGLLRMAQIIAGERSYADTARSALARLGLPG